MCNSWPLSTLSIRCPWAPVNVWTELPAWPTSTSLPAAGHTCVCVWMDLKVKGVRWTLMTANPTPADWAAVLTAPTPSPVSAQLEWQVGIHLQSCYLQNKSTQSEWMGTFWFSVDSILQQVYHMTCWTPTNKGIFILLTRSYFLVADITPVEWCWDVTGRCLFSFVPLLDSWQKRDDRKRERDGKWQEQSTFLILKTPTGSYFIFNFAQPNLV